MSLCKCGCGQTVTEGKKFIHGHWQGTPAGRRFYRKIGKRVGNSKSVQKFLKSQRWKRLASKGGKKVGNSPATLARLRSPEMKAIVRKSIQKVNKRPEQIALLKRLGRKIGKRIGNSTANIKRLKSLDMHIIHVESANRPEHIAFLKGPVMRAIHTNPENIYCLMSTMKPSQLEQRVFALIHNNHFPYDFVGDGKLLIGESQKRGRGWRKNYMCPDFVHRTRKVVVELAIEKEKKFRGYKSKLDYEHKRLKHFSLYGWRVLFLWSDMSDEEMLSILCNNEPKKDSTPIEIRVNE